MSFPPGSWLERRNLEAITVTEGMVPAHVQDTSSPNNSSDCYSNIPHDDGASQSAKSYEKHYRFLLTVWTVTLQIRPPP